MSASLRAHINPELLVWGRRSARMTVDRALRMLLLVIIWAASVTVCSSQDMEVYDVNKYGLTSSFPSIVIDENTTTGDYEVFSVDTIGLCKINPDKIVTSDEFTGTWRVYRVSDFGLRDLFPVEEAEQQGDRAVHIYDVGEFGLRDIFPSSIIQKNTTTGEVEVYDVGQYGLKGIFPKEVIRTRKDGYEVYKVGDYGLRELLPDRVVKVVESESVFGLILLPTIPKVVYDVNHPLVKRIRESRILNKRQSPEEELLRSK